MKIIDCVQGSPEWFKAKCGIPSASNFDRLLTADGKVSKQRTKYLYQLAGETVTGITEETYQNETMLRGKELEAEARQAYQLITGRKVKEVGFCLDNGCGASPDGLVGKPGLFEVKCPTMAIHIGYLLKNIFPMDYFQQLQGQMLVTNRNWCDFFSYYPGLRPFLIRVKRDEKFIKNLKGELWIFCLELKRVVKRIK